MKPPEQRHFSDSRFRELLPRGLLGGFPLLLQLTRYVIQTFSVLTLDAASGDEEDEAGNVTILDSPPLSLSVVKKSVSNRILTYSTNA